MKKKYKIVLIGAGNVATNIGNAIVSAGHEVSQVWSKTAPSSNQLAKKLGAKPITDIRKLNTNADIYILAIKDDAIRSIAEKIKLKDKLIVHTSGSTDTTVLRKSSENYGAFYPLQTFSKNKSVNFNAVPLFIEASNKASEKKLLELAGHLSRIVHVANSEKRKIIHLAAVFANNFSNHMYVIAESILKKNKIPFEVLIPLIEETVNKVKFNGPAKMQTGPAIRGDKKIMKEHLRMLAKDKLSKKIYRLVSKSILVNNVIKR